MTISSGEVLAMKASKAKSRASLPVFGECVLVLSGRLSFEIAQKSWKAGIPILIAVSAASSLAVALAQEANMGLISFTRDGTGNCTGALKRFELISKGA